MVEIYQPYSNDDDTSYVPYTGATTDLNLGSHNYLGLGSLGTGVYSGAYTDGIVVDYNNPDGRIIVGSADTLSFYNNGITSPFKLGGFSTTGLFTATGGFSGKNVKRVSTQTATTTVSINSDSYDIVYATDVAVAGTLTISADTGTGQTEGQSLAIKINCTNSQTFSWTTGAKGFYGGNIPLPATTTGGGKTDYYTFIWDSATSHWLYTGSGLGY